MTAATGGAVDGRSGAFLARLIAVALVVWLGLGAAFERTDALWRWVLRNSTPIPRELRMLRLEAEAKLGPAGRYPLFVYGSSVVAHDFDSGMLRAAAGLKPGQVGAVAAAGLSEVELAMALRHVVALRPKLVLHPVIVWSLHEPASERAWQTYDLEAALAIFGPGSLWTQADMHAAGLLAAGNPLFRHRQALRLMLLDPAAARATKLKGIDALVERDAATRMAYREDARAEEFRCDGPQARALAWMAERFAAEGVVFVTGMAPVRDRWGEHRDVVSRVDRCYAEIADQVGFKHLSHSVFGTFPRREFIDHMHLNDAGAKRFTQGWLPAIARVFEGEAS